MFCNRLDTLYLVSDILDVTLYISFLLWNTRVWQMDNLKSVSNILACLLWTPQLTWFMGHGCHEIHFFDKHPNYLYQQQVWRVQLKQIWTLYIIKFDVIFSTVGHSLEDE